MKIIKQLDCHGAYEVLCECGHHEKKLMHGIIWCANCMRNRPAHDMLIEFNKSVSPSVGQTKVNGLPDGIPAGGDHLKQGGQCNCE